MLQFGYDTDYSHILEDQVFQGIKPLADARADIFTSNLQVQAILPAIGIQYGMFGECQFDPSTLITLITKPEDLENQLINIGDKANCLQKSKLRRHMESILSDHD